MDTRNISSKSVSICFSIVCIGCIWLILTACGSSTPLLPTFTPVLPLASPTSLPTASPVSFQPPQSTPTILCIDNLLFIDDVTIPDNSIVTPGALLDKLWLVQNNGDCNWDARYRLRLISGDALGASPEQALYPARSGTQVNLRILFTAPQETGAYVSEWQAFDANGIPFGESFFIKVIVQ
jgi:Ig-like domain from next to BRCA1 gene